MSESGENAPAVVLDKPAINTTDPTQEVLDKLASYSEDVPDSQTPKKEPQEKNPYRAKLDEVRAEAKKLAEEISGRNWGELPKELQDMSSSLLGRGRLIFEDFFKSEIQRGVGQELLTFINPALTPEEVQEAQKTLSGYTNAEREFNERYTKKMPKEKLYELTDKVRRYNEALSGYGLEFLTGSFVDRRLPELLDPLFSYELSKLGIPVFNPVRGAHNIRFLRATKNHEIIREFFPEGIVDGFDSDVGKAVVEEAFEEEPTAWFSHLNNKDRYKQNQVRSARDSLVHFMNPELRARLIETIYSPSTPDRIKAAFLDTLAASPSPESLLHLVFIHPNYKDFFKGQDVGGNFTRMVYPTAIEQLIKLHKNADWPSLVDQFCQQYPEFAGLKEELIKFEISKRDPYSYVSYYGENSEAGGINHWVKRYIEAVKLRLAPLPSEPILAQYIRDKKIDIYHSTLTRHGLFTEEEGKIISFDRAVYEATKSDRERFDDVFSRDDSTDEERRAVIDRFKQIAKGAERLNREGLYSNGLRPEQKQEVVDFYEFALRPEHTPEEIDFLARTFTIEHFRGDFEALRAGFGHDEAYYKLLVQSIVFVYEDIFTKNASAREWREAFGEGAIKKWAELSPSTFVAKATKQEWRELFGEEAVAKFLDALPKESDEKRNALTHNEYDRTSEFVRLLINNNEYQQIFGLNSQDFAILTEYIEQFGFSRVPLMFHYFKQLTLLENGVIQELPPDMENCGISSKRELIQVVERMRTIAFGAPITDLSGLSSLELENLRIVTGKASHRFDMGRPSFQNIIAQFERDIRNEEIAPVPDGYKADIITLRASKIEFDSSSVREDFDRLSEDIREGLNNHSSFETQLDTTRSLLEEKLKELEKVRDESEGKKREHLEKEISRFQIYYNNLGGVDSVDTLMRVLAPMEMGRGEKQRMNTILRQSIFKALFSKNQNLRSDLEETLSEFEITPEKILKLVDLIKDPVGEHLVNMKRNSEAYWSEETWKIMRENRDNLRGLFDPYYSNLVRAVDEFQVTTQEGGLEIRMIPDRGFIGEMSGYLADVCYTAEYPLLRGREVVPYKFVVEDKVSKLPKFIGSVLVFEVNTAEGEPALLVRAFDVPNEDSYDVETMIESFLDKMVEVAKARGKKKILVPGNQSAMSNYRRSINHITSAYVKGEPVSLSEGFNFNGYDLTDNSNIAREVSS